MSEETTLSHSRWKQLIRLGGNLFVDFFRVLFGQELCLLPVSDIKSTAERSLDASRGRLQTRAEVLTQLSYEVRTPLSGLMGSLHLAMETALNDEQRQYLQAAFSSSEVLLQVLNLNIREKKSGPTLRPVNATLVPTHFSSSSKRVLVVEDNVINQMVAVAILKKQGLQVDAAINGQEAVKAVQDGRYDLVLMDCQMPIMSGYQATQLIRTHAEQAYPEIPIVAMTANAMRGDADRCLDVGMDDYLAKPVDAQKLATVVRKWLAVGEQRKRKYAKSTG